MMLIASNFVVWVIVLLLVIAVIGLTRQVAILRERIGARDSAPQESPLKTGDLAPVITSPTIDGRVVTIGGTSALNRPVLLLFVTTHCSTCRRIVRQAMVLARAQQLTLIFIGNGEGKDYKTMQQKLRMTSHDLINSPEVMLAYHVGKLPTAALIRPDGVLAALGLVSSRQHLEHVIAADHLIASPVAAGAG